MSARHAVPRLLVFSAQMEPAGGIESHLLEFCRRFAARGWRITLLCSRWSAGDAARRMLADAGVDLRLNESRLTTGSPAAKWAWTLAALARVAGTRFDAVYVNGQGRNAATVLRRYQGRARTVHHHHTGCDDDDVATWPAAYRTAMVGADALVVCAGFVRTRMRAALGRPDVDVAYCFSRRLEVPDAPLAPGAPVVFGYYGRLIPEKGIGLMLRLAAEPRLAGIEWRIWGPQGTYRAPDFAGHANLRYEGAFDDAAGLARALATLHCYCLFSTHPEGLPIALLECMGAGRAWIATPQGGIAELAHDVSSCAVVTLTDYDGVVAACAAMRDRLRAGNVRTDLQRSRYDSLFGEAVLVATWSGLLLGDQFRTNQSSQSENG